MLRFLVGAIFGAVAGALLAPQGGSDTRAILSERGETWRVRARDLGQTAAERYGPQLRSRMEPIAQRLGARFRHQTTNSDTYGTETEGATAIAVEKES